VTNSPADARGILLRRRRTLPKRGVSWWVLKNTSSAGAAVAAGLEVRPRGPLGDGWPKELWAGKVGTPYLPRGCSGVPRFLQSGHPLAWGHPKLRWTSELPALRPLGAEMWAGQPTWEMWSWSSSSVLGLHLCEGLGSSLGPRRAAGRSPSPQNEPITGGRESWAPRRSREAKPCSHF